MYKEIIALLNMRKNSAWQMQKMGLADLAASETTIIIGIASKAYVNGDITKAQYEDIKERVNAFCKVNFG